MHQFQAPRPPATGVPPIDTEQRALATVAAVVHRPLRAETVVVLLDDARRGLAVAVVTGTLDPDDVVEVVERLTHPAVHAGRASGVIVTSVRPGGGILPGDADRWLDQSETADRHGLRLLEWFVVGVDVTCPRDLFGERPRW